MKVGVGFNIMKYMKLEFPFDLALQFDDTVEDIIGKEIVEIPAVFGKKGWYAERKLKISWYEFPDGRAYLLNRKDGSSLYNEFIYSLKLLNYEEHRLSAEQVKAAEVFYGSNIPAEIRKGIQDLLYLDYLSRSLRNTYVTTRLYCQKSLKEIGEEDSETEDN